jgi:hypothetical protein
MAMVAVRLATESTLVPVPLPLLSPHSCSSRMSGCIAATMRASAAQLLVATFLALVEHSASSTLNVMTRTSVGAVLPHWARLGFHCAGRNGHNAAASSAKREGDMGGRSIGAGADGDQQPTEVHGRA